MSGPWPRARAVTSALLAVVAVAGYFLFVSTVRADPGRLSELVVTRPGVPGLEAVAGSRRPLTASQLPFSPPRAAAGHPEQIGGYTAEWQSRATSPTGAGGRAVTANLVLEALPDSASARQVQAEAIQRYTDRRALAASSLAIASQFTVPGVPGSQGVSYNSVRPGGPSTGTGYVVAFHSGRVVALTFLQTTTPAVGAAAAASFARAEHGLLATGEPGFSLSVTQRPAGPSTVYWIVALLVVPAAPALPSWAHRLRARRAARQLARARYGVRSRGAKAVRRHRTPAWARPRR